ncbi:MAG: ABC transporter permease [Armatimonadota bacterium]
MIHWRRVLAIIRREFIHIIRDPRSLGVAIVLPAVMLILYGYGINIDVKKIRTVVIDEDMTSVSRAYIDSYSAGGYFIIKKHLFSYDEIDHAIDANIAKVAIAVPKGFSADLAKGRAKVQVITDGSDAGTASLAMGYASLISQEFARNRLTLRLRSVGQPLPPELLMQIRYWYNPELNSTHFIVPGLIAAILMLLSALLTSMTIVRERENGTIEQIFVSPIKPSELMVGKLIPYIAIAATDIALVTLGGRYIFGVPFKGSMILFIIASALFIISALGIGLLISSISRNQLTAMMIAVLLTMLPVILLSGFVFPISAMPIPIQIVTYFIPARYYLVCVRGIFLKGVGFPVLWPQIAILAVISFTLLFACSKNFRKVL